MKTASDRPRCYTCDKAITLTQSTEFSGKPQPDAYWKGYGFDDRARPLFCTLSCASFFASEMVAAGHRLTLAGRTRRGGDRSDHAVQLLRQRTLECATRRYQRELDRLVDAGLRPEPAKDR